MVGDPTTVVPIRSVVYFYQVMMPVRVVCSHEYLMGETPHLQYIWHVTCLHTTCSNGK